jgi:hypothetical protein
MILRFCAFFAMLTVATFSGYTLTNWYHQIFDDNLHVSKDNDEELYNQFQILRGKVNITDTQTKENYTRANESLVFQRIDCKKCLYVGITDKEGSYEVHIPRGIYRLIARYGTQIGKTYDGVAFDQIRIIDVRSPTSYTDFNVSLLHQPVPFENDTPPIIIQK